MYKVILCAVEVGKEGKKVLAKAKELSEKFGSKIIVINVLPYTVLPKNYQKELKQKAIPEFDAFMADADIPKKNRMIKVGKPYEVICSAAVRKKADLILLGTHSKKGMYSLIGSTATGVAHNAQCDVSLVRMK